MKKKYVIISLLLLLILAIVPFFFSSSNSEEPRTNKHYHSSSSSAQELSYTYFTFERQWPGTVCKLKTCTRAKIGKFNSENFNLHGLWPSGSPSGAPCKHPQFCSDSSFSFSNIETSTSNYMKAYWVGLYSEQQWFLDHEWKKHGTCYSNNQNDYFTAAINLHKKYNPIFVLAAKNIVPSNEKPYKVAAIQSALDQGFNTKVLLQCENINGNQYILGIQMFFDRYFHSISQNPCSKAISSCSTAFPVYFPTL